MKQHSSKQTSGKAPAALSQPQQTATAKKKPTAEQIENALVGLVDAELQQFNCDLAIARRVYRSNPKLVTSKSYPEPWRSVSIGAGHTIGDRDTQKAPTVEQLRKQEMASARELATKWANEGEASDTGDSGVDIADSLRRGALREAQSILAGLAEPTAPIPVFDALLLRDLLLSYDGRGGLLGAIEDLFGLHSSKAA